MSDQGNWRELVEQLFDDPQERQRFIEAVEAEAKRIAPPTHSSSVASSSHQEPYTWRELLGQIIQDPQERQRLAQVVGVNPITFVRWAAGASSPRPDFIIRLIKAVPEKYHEKLIDLITLDADLIDVDAYDHAYHIISIRIVEEPLTSQNLSAIFSALTELFTKYWLIAKNQFTNLVKYIQTRDPRFAEEANVIVTKVTYNSPFNADFKVEASATNIADAIVITIDGITQAHKRLERAALENQAKAQEIKHTEQKADHDQLVGILEREKQQLEIERQRLEIEKQRIEVLMQQLEFQKKAMEYALEIASKVVDTLSPGADQSTRAMTIQIIIPNILQLHNAKGLEIVLPEASKNNKEH